VASALLVASAGVGSAGAELPPPIGVGALYHPAPAGPAARSGSAIAGLRCVRIPGPARLVFHLEVFGRRQVVLVPAGVGFAPPRRLARGRVLAGRCAYPVRTAEPTGVVLVSTTKPLRLGAFFDVWGQPLSRHALVGFEARGADHVRAFVDGRAWSGDPREIPIRPHAEIVLEIGGYVRPHASYRFPKGLP
jgi:hypothetical protein